MRGPLPPSATVAVYEKQPRWTPELQRQFLGQGVAVRGCGSLADVDSRLRDGRNSAVLLDLDASPAEVLRFLAGGVGRGKAPARVVVASERWAELEWRVRELGAVEFIAGPVSGSQMAELCRRQFTAG